MRRVIPFAVSCFLASLGVCGPALADTDKVIRSSLSEYAAFLKLPNVTTRSTAEIRQNADWLEKAFVRHGWSARQLPDGETPMVFAEVPGASPARKTVLFYAHMDGQPVRNAEWAQPDPFEPVLRTCADVATCRTVPLAQMASPSAGVDWRVFARSSGDDKAPIMMLITAMDALRAQNRDPAINVKVIIDSHEEGGGPMTLGKVVQENAALLKADAVVILDGPMHPSGLPTLVLGHRGVGVLRITVFGPKNAAHSGHYGNYIPNPAQNLVRLVASFKDEEGRVTIPGYYDGADPAFLEVVRQTPVSDDEKALLKHWGVATADAVGKTYREALSKPSLNLTGLAAGTLGETNATIIPPKAVASFDIRTVPGIPFDREAALVRKAVSDKGFHIVEGQPTDEERARFPLLASVEAKGSPDILFTRPDSPVGAWAIQALGRKTVVIPIMGGSVPSGPLVHGLNAPAVLIPLANADDNQHAANENMRLGTYHDGVQELMRLLEQPLAGTQ